MNNDEMRRFVNEEVVGQQLNGLFIEGRVKEIEGALSIVANDNAETIPSDQIKWLVQAFRYC